MSVYRMQIQYDGGRYNGWQRQGNTKNTIQEKIEQTLSRILGEEIEIQGAGRTDAGVHALAQVASFHTQQKEDINRWLQELNQYLPKDIRIHSLVKEQGRFHARLSATGKWYRYQIDNRLVGDVFERNYSMRISESLDLGQMRRAAQLLCGTHDYRSFCGNPKMKKSTVRTVDEIRILEENGKIVLEYHGDGFLYHMVRILTGTILEVGMGKRSAESMPELLACRKRSEAGFCVESQGLFLVCVEY